MKYVHQPGVGWSHQFILGADEGMDKLAEISEWCRDNFGPPNTIDARWCLLGTAFYFKDDTDAFKFKIIYC